MKLTLITATYNSGKVLLDCLNSVWKQDYNDIEHLIIDGGSEDDTLSVVEKFKCHNYNIKVFSDSDNGIYYALNKGIALATGEVIGFVHSDDLLADPKIVSKIMNCFNDGPYDGVYGNLQYVDKQQSTKVVRSWQSRDFEPGLLGKGWMPAHPTFFLKKEVYVKHGGFNLNYRIAADYDMMLRVLKDTSYRFVFLREVITKMRMGGASNRNLKNIIVKSREDYKILKRNHIRNPLLALFLKNISKVNQFF
ncbi:glycosyltransferase family 2 protein [Muriicola sp. Z0-33]|uniref:glycosyltransferase family 2 protein n=1 Tax=Muriicola sp. Z0-33 TaxID=2816957 RepID=UPI0022372A58|nr:glycosyltransferase family 2 protein [Muriicola sp. Z0-33]MCW5516904.1 glycosyltransferase [Muriicola sp. Z0-33]